MDKVCVCCHESFPQHPAVRKQRYCSKPVCQKERKKQWQRRKLNTDSAYRENQADAKRAWRAKNGSYWREYRAKHPAYVERNREKQRERNHKRPRKRDLAAVPVIAKMDALTPRNIILSGRYRLVPLATDGIAKMDALVVEIGIVSSGSALASPAGP
jgi:hypothetical protein